MCCLQFCITVKNRLRLACCLFLYFLYFSSTVWAPSSCSLRYIPASRPEAQTSSWHSISPSCIKPQSILDVTHTRCESDLAGNTGAQTPFLCGSSGSCDRSKKATCKYEDAFKTNSEAKHFPGSNICTAIQLWFKDVYSCITLLHCHPVLNKHTVSFLAERQFIPLIFIQSRSLVWSFLAEREHKAEIAPLL